MTMSPKLPAPAAFRLLSDLNEFLRYPQEVRESTLTAYMTGEANRRAALDVIEADKAAAVVAREAAARTLSEATQTAQVTVDAAEAKAKRIVDAATEQAESVNETARANVAGAADTVKVAQEQAKMFAVGLTEREARLATKVAAVMDREAEALEMHGDAEKMKAEYKALIRDISAVKSRAPR